MKATSFTAQEFRAALGAFATGVTVITAVTPQGERIGTTASSFNSVSLDPPLVLFSIARSAKAFAAWQSVDSYAINVLSEHQDDISTRFARPLSDKWRGLEPIEGPAAGLPLLPEALASIECASYARYDGGDHVIMVGQVLSVHQDRLRSRPLVFFGGRYRQLGAEGQIPTPADADIWLHGW